MSRGESATELSRRMKPDLPGGETQKQRDAIREEKAQAASDDSLAVRALGFIASHPLGAVLF